MVVLGKTTTVHLICTHLAMNKFQEKAKNVKNKNLACFALNSKGKQFTVN